MSAQPEPTYTPEPLRAGQWVEDMDTGRKIHLTDEWAGGKGWYGTHRGPTGGVTVAVWDGSDLLPLGEAILQHLLRATDGLHVLDRQDLVARMDAIRDDVIRVLAEGQHGPSGDGS
jgi:hypothetical protein